MKRLREILEALGYTVEESSGQDDTGRAFPLLAFRHGAHQLIAYEEKGGIQLVYPMDVRPEDTTLLEQEPDEIINELLSILKREMLEGRTAYALATTEPGNPKKWKAVKQIRVSQKVVVQGKDPYTVQRILDAIQEIVVVAVRCQLVLGVALRTVGTASKIAATTYHPPMYR